MNKPRFNAFNQIHKGLRALMFDTIMKVQQTDMADGLNVDIAIAQIELMLELFDAHAYHEDTFILKSVAVFSPDAAMDFGHEHEEDMELADKLRKKIVAYNQKTDQLTTGLDIYYTLIEFVAFNLRHMNKEEQMLNTVLWSYFTDEEIMEMERRIQQSISPDKLTIYFEWMIKGLNDTELLNWLQAVKSEAPDFVLSKIVQLFMQHLPSHRLPMVLRT